MRYDFSESGCGGQRETPGLPTAPRCEAPGALDGPDMGWPHIAHLAVSRRPSLYWVSTAGVLYHLLQSPNFPRDNDASQQKSWLLKLRTPSQPPGANFDYTRREKRYFETINGLNMNETSFEKIQIITRIQR
jgi:hypothetical protein